MTEKNLTPEEVSEITGGDIENIEDESNPEPLEPEEGDEPDIDSAAWDNERYEEDEENVEWKEIKYTELDPEDRKLYLDSVELRERFKNDIEHLLEHKDDIFWEEAEVFLKSAKEKRDASDNNASQAALYGLINTKMFEIHHHLTH